MTTRDGVMRDENSDLVVNPGSCGSTKFNGRPRHPRLFRSSGDTNYRILLPVGQYLYMLFCDEASSNVVALNKLFRFKNRFYIDLFRSYTKEGARRSKELRDGLQSLELLRMHDTLQRKVHMRNDIRPSPNQVPKNRFQLSLFLDRR
jgi:hypothetical protein